MDKISKEFSRLVHAYLDGTINKSDLAELNRVLSEQEDARCVFSEYLNLDSSIEAVAAGWQAEQEMITSTDPKQFVRWGLALAAVFLVALSFGWWRQLNGPPAFAHVGNSFGAETLAAGTALYDGRHVIRAGSIELITARGAHVVIEAPAEFHFESDQRLHVLRGRLAADVPPAAKGFTVITPSGEAVDLGTRFGVDVPAEGASEIHVFEGEVIAVTTGAKTEHSLLAGDALALAHGSSQVRDLRSAAFIQSGEFSELTAQSEPDRQEQSDAARANLETDPALITMLDFETNQKYDGVYRTVQGRWPGSGALEFVHNGDHLKLNIGAEGVWPQLTLAAWVRLDKLGAPYQSLLHSDGWGGKDNGRVHWMVNEATTMRFAMFGNTLAPGANELEHYPDSRTPVLANQGRWVHLVTVYDSVEKTVKFYHNGYFDKIAHLAIAHPARIGPAQIGNWNEAERKLSGRVDELIVLRRTMDDDEVRALFEAGNPYQ